MTAWWDRIEGAGDEAHETHSIYERRGMVAGGEARPNHELPTTTENVMGYLVEVPACCANPAECDRDECWKPFDTFVRALR